MTTPIPDAIQRFIDSTNNGDTPAFLDSFTSDAFLSDWGRDFTGLDQIGRWNQSDNIGKKSHLTISHLDQVGDSFVAQVLVRGNGYNGTGKMTFTLDGNAIARLIIA